MDYNQIETSSSCVTRELQYCVAMKDWKKVKALIKDELSYEGKSLSPEDQAGLLKHIKSERLKSRMEIVGPITPDKIVPRILDEEEGKQYLVRCGNRTATGYFYKSSRRKDEGLIFYFHDVGMKVHDFDEIYELNIITDFPCKTAP